MPSSKNTPSAEGNLSERDARSLGRRHDQAGSAAIPVAKNQTREQDACAPVAIRFRITGAVQGVGFRPFVYRLAHELGISGWVKNDTQGVLIEACANFQTLEIFENALRDRAPAAARIKEIIRQEAARPATESGFRILDSDPQRREDGSDPARPCDLPRLPRGNLRSRRPPPPVSVHQLHELRAAIQHHRAPSLRPAEHDDETVRDVRPLSGRIRRSGQPPFSRPAKRLSGLRAAPGVVEQPRDEKRRGPGRTDRGGQRPAAGAGRRGKRPRRLSSHGRRAKQRSRAPFARAQAPRGKTAGPHVPFARCGENRLRSFTDGRAHSPVAGIAHRPPPQAS